MNLKCLQATYANVWYITKLYASEERKREKGAIDLLFTKRIIRMWGGGSFYTIRYLEMVVQCVLVNVLYKIRRLNYIS